jgi:hypothetical protein
MLVTAFLDLSNDSREHQDWFLLASVRVENVAVELHDQQLVVKGERRDMEAWAGALEGTLVVDKFAPGFATLEF